MDTRSQISATGKAEGMPAGARRAVFAAVAVVLAGALYLIAVRGEALLLDLSALSQRMFCF